MRLPIFLFAFLLAASCAFAQESLNNLPLPRWATLATPEANLRTGPGKRYPIDWVLKKQRLPVEITQEFDNWRRIREPGGSDGWIHRSMLSGVRHAMLKQDGTMFSQPNGDSRVLAKLQKGVIATLSQCQKDWCRLKVDQYDGWVRKKSLWGVYPDEVWKN